MLHPSSYISKHRLNELCVVTKCHTHNDPTDKKKKKEVEKCSTHSCRDSLVQRKDDYSCFKSDRGLYHHPSEWALLLCLKYLKNAQDISSRVETASLRHTELSQTPSALQLHLQVLCCNLDRQRWGRVILFFWVTGDRGLCALFCMLHSEPVCLVVLRTAGVITLLR